MSYHLTQHNTNRFAIFAFPGKQDVPSFQDRDSIAELLHHQVQRSIVRSQIAAWAKDMDRIDNWLVSGPWDFLPTLSSEDEKIQHIPGVEEYRRVMASLKERYDEMVCDREEVEVKKEVDVKEEIEVKGEVDTKEEFHEPPKQEEGYRVRRIHARRYRMLCAKWTAKYRADSEYEPWMDFGNDIPGQLRRMAANWVGIK